MRSEDLRALGHQASTARERFYHELYDKKNTYMDYLNLMRAVAPKMTSLMSFQEQIFEYIENDSVMTEYIKEDLISQIIMGLNDVLDRGSPPRIASLDVGYKRKAFKYNFFNMGEICKGIYNKPPVFSAITGGQGYGKSHLAALLIHELTRHKRAGFEVYTNLYLTPNNKEKEQMERIHMIDNAKDLLSSEGKVVFVLDEAHLFWNKMNQMSKQSRLLSYWITLLRKFDMSVIMVSNSYDRLPNMYLKHCTVKFHKNSKKSVFVTSDVFTSHIGEIPQTPLKFHSKKVLNFNVNFTEQELINLLNIR